MGINCPEHRQWFVRECLITIKGQSIFGEGSCPDRPRAAGQALDTPANLVGNDQETRILRRLFRPRIAKSESQICQRDGFRPRFEFGGRTIRPYDYLGFPDSIFSYGRSMAMYSGFGNLFEVRRYPVALSPHFKARRSDPPPQYPWNGDYEHRSPISSSVLHIRRLV